VTGAWIRCTAAAVVLCLGLAEVPVFAEEPAFVLLPDKSLGALDVEEPTARIGRDWIGLGRDTLLLASYQVVAIGVLYVLPESTTGWTDEMKKAGFDNWWNHVRNPQWDSDEWYLNYIGHPYFGAAYYTRARERGFNELDSFLYSALASAMYEFGVEAIFERPSYQDLILTPVGGALLGFALEPVRNWVKRKPEPRWYSHVILVATDPIGALNHVFERLVGIKSDIRVDVGRDRNVHVELRLRWN
jgi:Domain of unknown function (DUF3943)